jgi:hypothetical protein
MSSHSFTDGIGSGEPDDTARNLDRRAFLRAAGATAAWGSGFALLGGLLETQPAFAAAGVSRAREGVSAATAASVLLGGAQVRPPSVPLAVRSPYLSTWLPATGLTANIPQFWDGSNRGFAGLVRIDGKVYVWAGQPVLNGAAATPLTQTSLQVTATRSIFTFNGGGIQLIAEWLSPIEPGDLRRASMPFSLLTVSVSATDGAGHSVQVYADITGEWAASDESDSITWAPSTTSSNRYWSIQLQSQDPLTEDAHMAGWGSAIWGSPLATSLTYQSGFATNVRDQFATAGKLADTNDTGYRAVDINQPVFAFARDLGTVKATAQSVSFAVGHVRTPLVSYGTPATLLAPWWTKYWSSWSQLADFFFSDASPARTRAIALDAKIQNASTKAAGTGYSAICALAARQCYGGMELAVGTDGKPWLMGKEISSGGDVNTVDIFDQAYLMWLWLDPSVIPLEMAPVLTWADSPGWQNDSLWSGIPSWQASQTKYCVHDLGVYPVASGRAPGNGEQMPVEESAGMLIMAASYARKVGAATAKPFLAEWQLLWTQWAQYLLTQVPTPDTQLTTDDWAPVYSTTTGGTNLAIKAIIGLAAAAQIAEILGDAANAAIWSQAAINNVQPWVKLSLDPSGQYLNLEQGTSGTWTTIYNAFYEVVIGESLVPQSIKALQAAFYLTQLEPYGLPLQTSSNDLSKVAWNVYIPALLNGYPIAAQMLSRDTAYINDTPSLVPYGDRYNTSDAVEVSPIKAHPTIGAVFALLAVTPPDVTTAVSPGALAIAPGKSAKVTLTNTNTDPNGGRLTLKWSAAPPSGSGITVTPSSGSASLNAGASASVTLTVAVSGTTAAGPVTIPVTVTSTVNGTTVTSPGSYLQVNVAYQSLAAAFGNVGITQDSAPSLGNFDGDGNSFSATALAQAGITAGGVVTSGGVTFTWPTVAPGTPDNVLASGQTILVSGPGGGTLGFLGAATDGPASGTGTIGYADGSTQAFTIGFENWIDATPVNGDALVATTSYFNRTTAGKARTPSLFAAFVSLQSSQNVAYVTLPYVSSAKVSGTVVSVHIFAIGFS